MGNLSRFIVADPCVEGEFFAMLKEGEICAIVSQEDGMYVPSVARDEWGESVKTGVPMSTPEHAAGAAILLARMYLTELLSGTFAPPTGSASVIVADGKVQL